MSSEPDIRPVGDDGELRPLAPVRDWRPRLWNGDRLEPCPELLLVNEPRHPRCEAIRALRTRLLLARDSARYTGVLAVTSPGAAEGRSELCAELASAFAQLGRATLLIDADLRNPREHRLFGEHNRSGLAQALHRNESPWIYGVSGIPPLAVLTSGGIPENPLELLSAGHFEQVLAGCRRDYEFVVIDTPPATRYSDALAIAAVADRVLVVTRARATSFEALTDMVRQLSATSAHVAGAIINRF
jgi:capsular exopolysaccharide synthesis family protein